MTQPFRSRMARAALPMVAAAALLPFAPAAHAAPGDYTATYAGPANGLDNVIKGPNGKMIAAGSDYLKLSDGSQVRVFCIQFNNFEVEKSGTYRPATWPAAGLTNQQLGKVADIIGRHRAIGTNFTNAGMENAAVQVAVWKITDDVKYKEINNAAFVARVKELVEGSSAANSPKPEFDYALRGEVSTAGDSDVVQATLTSHGKAAAGYKVTFNVDGTVTDRTTDSSGVATLVLPDSASERQVTASFKGRSGQGVVFVPDSGKQALMSTTGFDLAAQTSMSIAATVAQPTPEPTPTPTQEPTQEPTVVAEPTPTPTPTPSVEPTEPVSVPSPPAPQPEPSSAGDPTTTPTPDTSVKKDPKTKDKEPKVDVVKDPVPKEFPKTGALPLLAGLLGVGALGGLGLWGMRRFR